MPAGLLLLVVIRQSAVVLELLAGEDELAAMAGWVRPPTGFEKRRGRDTQGEPTKGRAGQGGQGKSKDRPSRVRTEAPPSPDNGTARDSERSYSIRLRTLRRLDVGDRAAEQSGRTKRLSQGSGSVLLGHSSRRPQVSASVAPGGQVGSGTCHTACTLLHIACTMTHTADIC